MIRSPLSTTSVLDEASEVVSMTAAPWAAVLVVTALPYRFLQAMFLDQLFEVGAKASQYGNLLGGTANLIVISVLVALWGRAVYARACRLAHGRGTPPGRESWRVPIVAFASYVLTASAALLIGYVGLFTCIGFFVAMLFAGLAVGTMELNERVSAVEPFRLIARYARTATLLALTFVFFCAWFVALVNLAAAFGLGVWAASAIGGFDAPQWQLLFTGGNRRFILLLCAGAVVAVEPFWVAAQVVFVRKAGAQERGDDLRAWFEEFRSAATAVAALVLLLTAGSAAAAPRVTLHEYVAALETIDAQLATNQLAAAKDGARALTGADVVWSKGTFKTDAAMLGAIVNASRAEGPHRTRLVVAIGELRRAGGMETARADRKALEQIAAEQEPPALPAGGELKLEMEGDLSLFERILESIGDALEWIAKKLRQFIDWLRDLLPRSRRGDSSMTPGLRWIVIGVVSLIVLLIIVLAINVLRRSRAAAEEPQTSAPIGSKRDEDPLSRGATEWERYAADLAAAGRHREAIRAWYHAVLVTCYAAGILHFRKGRTNWEYIALLAPSLEWRAELITLTRRFEQEWYGHDESSIDALTDCSENAQSILDSIRGEMRGAA